MINKLGLIILLFVAVSSGCQCGHDNKYISTKQDSTLTAADLQLRNANERIKEDSNKADNYFLKGNVLMSLDSFKEAYMAYSKAISKDSHDIKYYKAISEASIQGGNLKGAISSLKIAIKHEPSPDTKLLLAQTYLYLRQYDDAKVVLDDVLGNNPDNDKAYILKGFIQKETGDTLGALKSFQSAAQTNNKNTEAYMQLGALNAKRHNLLAVQYFDNAIRIDSNNSEAYLAKATFLEKIKQDGAAKRTYRSLIARDPFNEDAVFNLAFLYMKEDSTGKAHKYYDLCIQIQPDDADAYYYRGVCASILGRKADAISDWNQCLNLKPDFVLAKEALIKAGVK